MNNLYKIGIFGLIGIFLIAGCKKDKVGAYDTFQPTSVIINYPSNFPDMYIPEDNLPTKEGIALGRALYYDKILSKNQDKSCSSCHDQTKAFTTYESNSLAHINLGWNDQYLWNGRFEGPLEKVMMFEVNDFFETNIQLLNENSNYRTLFKKAYGVDEITAKDIAYALAQFFRTLNSTDSKFDKFMRGEVNLTPEELDGYDIFYTERGDCFHCHGTVLFHDNFFGNNGLDPDPDAGLYTITGNMNDYGKFKTPTLRNIELTAPYMHDGRFETLEEVVKFYSFGVNHDSPNLSPLMKYSLNGGVQLTQEETQHLIAFLKTLTDYSFTSNPTLSNPN